jgi:transposase InsO family protein
MAIRRCRPDADLIHHSDQGSQYTDGTYQALLRDHGIQLSMNGLGGWYDNAPMKSFFGGGVIGPFTMDRIVLRSCPVMRAISLMVTPLRCKSLIMNRSSTFSIAGLLFDTPANQAIVPQVRPLERVGSFILALLGILSLAVTRQKQRDGKVDQ